MNSEDWRNVPCLVKPYKGQEPYIFISYAHKDAAMVFPVIERLVAEGHRVWYDEGIDPGSEWPEIIANRLSDCTACIAFISQNSLDSHNCRREINFALHKQKHFISVMLEEVTMSAGMEMQLSVNQSIFKYKLRTEQDFYDKLYEAEFLNATKQQEETKIVPPIPEEPKREEPVVQIPPQTVPETVQPASKKKKKGVLIALLIAVVLIAGGVLAYILLSEDDSGRSTIRMSSDLYDFTICIEDDVIQLPCSYETMANLGWKLEDSVSAGDMLDSKGTTGPNLYKDGHQIQVLIGNPSSSQQAIEDCMIIGIGWESSFDSYIMFSKGIEADTPSEQLIDAYGEPMTDVSGQFIYFSNEYAWYLFAYDEYETELVEVVAINTDGVSYDGLFGDFYY